MDIDDTIEGPAGGEMDIPESMKKSLQSTRVSDTLAEYISEAAVNLPEIRSTELMKGSGNSGRQSQLYLKPADGVSKDELRSIGHDLKGIIDPIFPSDFLVGLANKKSVDDDGRPVETDEFYIYLVYRARTASGASKPAGDSTEVL